MAMVFLWKAYPSVPMEEGDSDRALTAIAKIAPQAVQGEGLPVRYSGSFDADNVSAGLDLNCIERK